MEREYAIEVRDVDDLDKRQLLFISKKNIDKRDLLISSKVNFEYELDPTQEERFYILSLKDRFYKISENAYKKLQDMGIDDRALEENKEKHRRVVKNETREKIKKMLK